MHSQLCGGHKVAWGLVWIGAINWGLVGAFQFNLVNTLVGSWPTVERIVYVLVGVAALMMLLCSGCKGCKPAAKG